jgi:hypothetical protein
LEITDLNSLKKILEMPYEKWREGSGTSSIDNGSESLVFFILKDGIFIEHYPSGTAPLFNSKEKNNILTLTHYVSGEPTVIPNVCLANIDQALEIFKVFLEKGILINKYDWVDIFDLIEDKYDQ